VSDEFWAGRYADQSVLVTGGAGGIGTVTTTRLAAEGAAVGIVDINSEAAEALAEKLRAGGHEAYAYPVDVTDPARVAKAFDDFERKTGKIDALVNLVGDYPWIPFDDMTLEQWRQIVAVNLDSTFVACRDVMPRMIKRGYGRISTTSSATVYLGLTEHSAYIAAKIGVTGFTRVLARRGGPHGVTANAVCPGMTDTQHNRDLLGDHWQEAYAGVVATQSVPRTGQPADIAEGIAWVCSKQASFYTGQVLYVGGGDHFSI
jgi:NAD(P)-dependent dehydrogenase (short-subunit alcohol dehydrogenase family)